MSKEKLRLRLASLQEKLYLPTVCNPCLVQPRPAKTGHLPICSNCGLVRYCSPEHQKLDWPLHKPLCRAAKAAMIYTKTDNVMKIVAHPMVTRRQLDLTILKLKFMLKHVMKRDFEHHEEEIASFPIVCAVCLSIDPRKLYQCKGCNVESYCCKAHEREHYEDHRFECLYFKMYYCIFQTEPEPNFQIESLNQPCDLLDSYLSESVKVMFGVDFPDDPCNDLDDYQTFSFVSSFSWIATITYAMAHLDMDKYTSDTFTIYIGGVTNDYLWFTKCHLQYFFACYPKIKLLNIVFVGPELVMVQPRKKIVKMGNRRKVCLSLHQRTFQDYITNKDHHLRPNMVVFYNCGFSEHKSKDKKDDPWYPGLTHLMDLPEIPIVFTSYTNLEAEFDFAALVQVAEEWNNYVELETIIKKHENPYRELKPLRNYSLFSNETRIFYRNGMIQAVRVKFSC